jgi:hypothetical protein
MKKSKPKRKYKKIFKIRCELEIKHKYYVSPKIFLCNKNIPDVLRSLEEKQN